MKTTPDSPPLRIGADGSLPVNGSVDVGEVSGTVDVSGTVNVGSVGSIAEPIQTKPTTWEASGFPGVSVDDTGDTEIGPELDGRGYMRFTNTGANNVYFRAGDSPATTDTKLVPGASMEFHGGYAGVWKAITDTGLTSYVSVVEFKLPSP